MGRPETIENSGIHDSFSQEVADALVRYTNLLIVSGSKVAEASREEILEKVPKEERTALGELMDTARIVRMVSRDGKKLTDEEFREAIQRIAARTFL